MATSYSHDLWFLGNQHCLCHIFIHLLVNSRITILQYFILRDTFIHFQLLTHYPLPPIASVEGKQRSSSLDSIKLYAGILCMLHWAIYMS